MCLLILSCLQSFGYSVSYRHQGSLENDHAAHNLPHGSDIDECIECYKGMVGGGPRVDHIDALPVNHQRPTLSRLVLLRVREIFSKVGSDLDARLLGELHMVCTF